MKTERKEESPDTQNRKFVNQLIAICDNRGRRAELRRFWSPTTRHYAYPILGDLGAHPMGPRAIVAALYAINPHHKEGGDSIGKACLYLAGGNSKAPEFKSFEPHFFRLLASNSLHELGKRLYQIFRRLSRLDSGQRLLDYYILLKNLCYWTQWSESVKIRWSMDFWQAPRLDQSLSE